MAPRRQVQLASSTIVASKSQTHASSFQTLIQPAHEVGNRRLIVPFRHYHIVGSRGSRGMVDSAQPPRDFSPLHVNISKKECHILQDHIRKLNTADRDRFPRIRRDGRVGFLVLFWGTMLKDTCTILCLGEGVPAVLWIFFFYCKAERAVKPCRSSRSNTRGGMAKSHDTCKTGNKHKPNKQTQTKNKTPTRTTNGKCHWMVRQVVKKSETPEAARSSHVLNSTMKHKVSLSSSVRDDVDIP